MIPTRFARSALAVALLVIGASTAHAQQAVQAFEDKYGPPRTSANMVQLPTFGIGPAGTTTLDANVAEELTEVIQREMAVAQEMRFEISARPSTGGKVVWALVVRDTPRAVYDSFKAQFAEQLRMCLHSVPDNLDLANLNVILTGSPADDALTLESAKAAGRQMLANWKTERCATRRNSVGFIDDEAHRIKYAATSHGMLIDEFEPVSFPSAQALLDLIAVLKPLYFDLGGFWTTEMMPRLRAVFEAAVRDGFLSVSETSEIGEIEQRTFWDWAVLVVLTKPMIARSFLANTAAGCVRTVPELSSHFQLSHCVSDGRIQLKLLRVGGQDYTAVQRVLP
jgi:hypothetical protein